MVERFALWGWGALEHSEVEHFALGGGEGVRNCCWIDGVSGYLVGAGEGVEVFAAEAVEGGAGVAVGLAGEPVVGSE